MLCATASFFMLWQCSLCCGKKMMCCSVVWHCSLCCSKKCCIAVLCSILCCHFFVPGQEMTCCCIPQHVALCCSIAICATVMFLCATARNDVPWCCLIYCTIVLHSAARNNELLHSVTLRIMPWHVHHAMALFAVPWPMFHATMRMVKQSACAALATLVACGGHFGLGSCGVFCGGCCFVVFKGEQSTCLLWWPQWSLCHSIVHSSMTFCGTIFVLQCCFMFCAVVLCFVPLHSFLCHGAVFVPQCHALCCGNVIGAMAVCYV